MPRATRQQGRETFSGEDNHGKKRKKVAEEVVEKEGDAPEEPLGIKEERVDYPSPCLHPLPNTKALTPLLFLHLFHCKL
jgi:hypothetical protein